MSTTSKVTVSHELSTRGRTSKPEAKAETKILADFIASRIMIDTPTADVSVENQLYSRADLLAINQDGYVVEYELKTSSSDLHDELNKIATVIECNAVGINRFQRLKQLRYEGISDKELDRLVRKYCIEAEHSKYLKHEWYLDTSRPVKYEKLRKPNQFYFVVHASLAPVAIRKLTGTPYGLISAEPQLEHFTVLKPAEHLHTETLEIN